MWPVNASRSVTTPPGGTSKVVDAVPRVCRSGGLFSRAKERLSMTTVHLPGDGSS